MDIEYQAAGASHRGLCRARNEDSYALRLNAGEAAGDFVVSDGVGGGAAGDLASRVASETMLREMSGVPLSSERMRHAVHQANWSVYSRARSDPALAGMGTTLVALAVRGRRACVAHVGDSRCYRRRGGRLERLTQDHSLVEDELRGGRLTQEQAAFSPLRNIITRAVGAGPEVTADLLEMEVAPGDLYLLATDGLTSEVMEEKIAEILSSGGPPAWLCAQLIEAANWAGGSDNITCILVQA